MGFRFFEETRFKETEIGLIPEDWEVVRLGEVGTFSRGLSWRKVDETNSENGKLIISIPNIENEKINFNSKYNHYINKKIPETKKLYIGDIIFVGSSGSIKNIGRNVFIDYLPFEGIGFASFTFKATPRKDKINNKFFYYLANSGWFKYNDFSKRASDGKYNFQLQEFIEKNSIPLPPLSEQKAIAEVLKTIQEAKEKTEAVIKATRELKKSMMKQLFSYGVNRVNELRVDRVNGVEELGVHRVRELGVNGVSRVDRVDRVGGVDGVGELKDTEIGVIPKHWQVVRLGEVAEIKTSFLDFNKLEGINDPNEKGILVNYVKVSDMNLPMNHLFIYQTNISKIIKKTPSVLRRLLKPYSLIFPKRGGAIGTNKKRITRYYSVLDPNLLGISILDNSLDIYFLHSYFELFVDLKSLQDNTPIPQLNKHNFENLLIPLPPLSEQKAIAEILQAIDDKIQKEEAKKQAIEKLFRTMLRNLMSGKLRVNRVESE